MPEAFRRLQFFGALVLALPIFGENVPSPPADNPYAPAFAAFARLTPEDATALKEGQPASPAAAPLLAEITKSLAAGRQASTVDWGVDYSHFNLFTMDAPGANAALVSLVVLHSAENATSSVLVDRALDTLAVGQHVGRDMPIISYLRQRKIESLTSDWLQKHFGQLSPHDARHLLAGIDTLPAGGNLGTALAMEKIIFLDRLTDDIRQVIEQSGEADASSDNFSSRLRLAGILTDGPVTSVGLEQATTAFWLKPGETKHAITLLSVNRAHDEALLACDGRIARVVLSSKKIAVIDFSRIAEAIAALPESSLLRQCWNEDAAKSVETYLRSMELANREIGDLYSEAVAHPEHFDDSPAYKERVQKLSPLAQNIGEMLPALIRVDKKSRETQAALRAALFARAEAVSPSPDSSSPTDRPPDRTPATANRPR